MREKLVCCLIDNKKARLFKRAFNAEGGIRTHMSLSSLRPERSASACFATSAEVGGILPIQPQKSTLIP
jgi:hypothetical protein